MFNPILYWRSWVSYNRMLKLIPSNKFLIKEMFHTKVWNRPKGLFNIETDR
jgi:hypothetical protein